MISDAVLRSKICSCIIAFAICCFTFFMGLGVLRLYSLRLEHKLNVVNAHIAKYEAEYVVLTHEIASLTTPSRIYGFSQQNLGMTVASNVRILRVEDSLVANRSGEASPSKDRKEGWFYFFLEGAMAGE